MNTRNLKSIIRKLSAICLAFIMSFGMLISANALETNATATITVHGGEKDNGANINAYKLINISFDDANQQLKEPVYTWTDNASLISFIEKKYPSYIDKNNHNAVTNVFMNLSAENLKTFYTDLLAFDNAADNDVQVTLNPDFSGTISNTNNDNEYKAELSGVTMGWYLVTASKDGINYNPMTAFVNPEFGNGGYTLSDADIFLKGSEPTITKTATTNDNDKTVAVGDTVTYTINSEIPVYPSDAVNTTYIISDTLSSGLTFNSDSILVMIGTTKVDQKAYTIYTQDTADDSQDYVQGSTFTIVFKYDELIGDQAYIDADENADEKKITVSYTATVNSDAVVSVDSITNDASLKYANDPYVSSSAGTTSTSEKIYTYGIKLTKYGDNGGKKDPLGGVHFTLKNSDDTPLKFNISDSGVYIYDPNGTTDDLVTATNGTLTIKGIDTGTYKLFETKAADGYVCPTTPFEITLIDDKTGADVSVADGSLDSTSGVDFTKTSYASIDNISFASLYSDVDAPNNILTFDITNYLYSDEDHFQLPSTGGMGTVIFTVGGIAVMAAAVALGIYSSRKRNA